MAKPATPRQILSTLADLAPDSDRRRDQSVSRSDLVALPISYTSLLRHQAGLSWDASSGERVGLDASTIEPLLKRSKLHDDEGLLRIGWMWVLAPSPSGSTVLFPLVSMPVRPTRLQQLTNVARRVLLSKPSFADIVPAGEAEVTDLIDDPTERNTLEQTLTVGGGALSGRRDTIVDPTMLRRLSQLQVWARRASAAAGYPAKRFVERIPDRPTVRSGSEPVLIPQIALYLAEPERRAATIASTLRSWDPDELDETAFAALYGHRTEATGSIGNADGRSRGDAVDSSIVLSPTQRTAVAESRRAPVTVISGPPGTGKTQTIAAIALDAVERGQSVLVAAPTPAAVDALIDLLTRIPGPDPLVFGASERRAEVADRLGQGGGTLVDSAAVRRAEQAFRSAADTADALRQTVVELLSAESHADDADPALVFHSRRLAPAWFGPDAKLAEPERLLGRIDAGTTWLSTIRRRRWERALIDLAGGGTSDIDQLRRALRVATASKHAAELQATGGLDIDRLWARLIVADEERRVRKGDWLNATAHAEDRVTGRARSTMALVAAALRSGRASRRQKLGEIDGERIAEALPLWVGTLRDIDDLLPRTGGMFDLVVVDEASQVDQITAAPALLRARRAVVVGDPKQLRHVSFLADDTVRDTLLANDITDPTSAGRLDVRRLSLFDLAAAAAPTRFLDEHFRSAPHLIDFSARQFYGGSLTIATAHPANHDRDCISVEFLSGTRVEGVNAAEVDEIIRIVRQRQQLARDRDEPIRIGIVSPFRAQADALERRIVEEFDLADIDELALRVGTVHGFQGCERDLVLISLALDDESPPSARSFLNDAHLFNVMVTRARDEIVVITCLSPETPGLAGAFLRHGHAPPNPPRSTPPGVPLARSIADELRRSGVELVSGYRSGRHELDLVLGSGTDALGLVFGVHPDGPEMHIERHLALSRSGWELRDVFESRWGDRHAELAIELTIEAKQRAGNGRPTSGNAVT